MMKLFFLSAFLAQNVFAQRDMGFPCNDRKLLPSSARCDGYPDCAGGEDELGCNSQSTGGWSRPDAQVNYFNRNQVQSPLWTNQISGWPSPQQSTGWTQLATGWTNPPAQPTTGWSNPPAQTVRGWRNPSAQAASPWDSQSSWNNNPRTISQSGYLNQPKQYEERPIINLQPNQQQYPAGMCESSPPSRCPVPWMSETQRWYYDNNNLNCQKFKYSCGDGYNNFQTESECEMVCTPESEIGPSYSSSSLAGAIYPHSSYPSSTGFKPSYPGGNYLDVYGSPGVQKTADVYGSPGAQNTAGRGSPVSSSVWKSSTNIPLLTSLTFQKYLEDNDRVLVEFFAKWCDTCIEFQPKFGNIARTLNSMGIATAKVDIDEEPGLVNMNNVNRFPSLLYWSKGLPDCPRKYHNGYGLNSSGLIHWVQYQLGEETKFHSRIPSSEPTSATSTTSMSAVPTRPSTTSTIPDQSSTGQPSSEEPSSESSTAMSTSTIMSTSTTMSSSTKMPSSTIISEPSTELSSITSEPSPTTSSSPTTTTESQPKETSTTSEPSTERSSIISETLPTRPTENPSTETPTTTSLFSGSTEVVELPEYDGCDRMCTQEYYPVCGSDMVTYSNKCVYNTALCKTPELYLLGTGECSTLQKQNTCKRTEFVCKTSGVCISFLKTCNGVDDCGDGSDEEMCTSCSKTEFTCGDGSCIDYSKRCDREINCADSSDEVGCKRPCTNNEFTCNDGNCIPQVQRCNGQVNCQDMTDEIGCQGYNFCKRDEWMCEDKRKCIKASQKCDGFPDCGDVSDEQGCPPNTCNSQWLFSCSNSSQCIDVRRRCDGYQDCRDSSDERGCLDIPCQDWQHKCQQDGVCIHKEYVCNGLNDCKYGSDEADCEPLEPEPNATSTAQSAQHVELELTTQDYDTTNSDIKTDYQVQTESNSDEEYTTEKDYYSTKTDQYYETSTENNNQYYETSTENNNQYYETSTENNNQYYETSTENNNQYYETSTENNNQYYETSTENNNQYYETSTKNNNQYYETSTEVNNQYYETSTENNNQFYETSTENNNQFYEISTENNNHYETTMQDNENYYETTTQNNNKNIETTTLDDHQYYETTKQNDNQSYESTTETVTNVYDTTQADDNQNYATTKIEENESYETTKDTIASYDTTTYPDQDTTLSDQDGEEGSEVFCNENEFMCVLTTICISTDFVCDGNVDCLDSTDEANCGEETPRGNDGGPQGTQVDIQDIFGFDEDMKCEKVCTREYRPVCASNQETYSSECMMEIAACKAEAAWTVLHEGVCDSWSQREMDACLKSCAEELSEPVCGSDGVTYDNTCLMDKTSCQESLEVVVLFKGSCEERDIPKCDHACTKIYLPVCGSDGITYNNECIMRKLSCLNEEKVELVRQGSCDDPKPQCQESCEKIFLPVCGDDGITYDNVCIMRREACLDGVDVNVEYEGNCRNEAEEDPFANLFDPIDNILCPTSCPEDLAPVCGDDGVTYQNECKLRMEECKLGTRVINIKYQGSCQGNRCDSLCTESTFLEVCGTDSVTYPSECSLRKFACNTNTDVTVQHQGQCASCHPVDEWMCRDSSCVSSKTICDGKKDCPDGTDEDFCEFICNDGTAIRISEHCNGVPDCFEGEDENNCNSIFTSSSRRSDLSLNNAVCDSLDEYSCKDTRQCIPREKKCDGKVDCLNEDDEFDCNRVPQEGIQDYAYFQVVNGGGEESASDEGRGDITADDTVEYSVGW